MQALGGFLLCPSALALCLFSRLFARLRRRPARRSLRPCRQGSERPADTSPEQRAELRRELERRVEVLEAQSAVVKIAAKLVGPSVVRIEADIPPEADGQYENGRHVEESGSGVIISSKEKYYVLTSRHVVRNAAPPAVRIRLADGRLLHPGKILVDADSDVGVLEVSASGLIAGPLGDSDRMEIGDFVLAVGSPFGLSQYGDLRDHQRQGPPRSSFERRRAPLPGLPANRRGDQPRQQRRPAGQPPRRDHRHQRRHRQQVVP